MTVNQPFSVVWLSDLEMPLANKFYRTHKFRGKARRNEPCAVIKNQQHQIIACGCLKQFAACQLLAGVAVAEEYRGQGVARQLLHSMTEAFDKPTFTFPYQNLVPFYRSLDFVEIEVNSELIGGVAGEVSRELSEILDRFLSYQRQGRAIVLMRYQEQRSRQL